MDDLIYYIALFVGVWIIAEVINKRLTTSAKCIGCGASTAESQVECPACRDSERAIY
jgi:hypothetical protein